MNAHDLESEKTPAKTFPEVCWFKNDPKKYVWHTDGSVYLVALQVTNNKTKVTRWEFAVLQVSCDEDNFDLHEHASGEFYSSWEWSDFEYFHLVSGAMPEKGPEEDEEDN